MRYAYVPVRPAPAGQDASRFFLFTSFWKPPVYPIPILAFGSDFYVLIKAFVQSDFIGQAIVVILFALSIYLTSKIIEKFRSLHSYKSYNDDFLRFYAKKAHPVQPVIDPRGLTSGSPIGTVYIAGANCLLAHLRAHGLSDEALHAWTKGEVRPLLTPLELEDIRSVCDRTLAKQQLDIESTMSRISTSIALAPSLGLLGTVWGVMVSFMSMSSGGASMISAVAPGISGALLTTVAGLFVAIGATLCYNMLIGYIRRQVNQMEIFEEQFLSDIKRIHALPEGAPSTLQLNFQSQPTFAPAPSPRQEPPSAPDTSAQYE